MKEHPILFSAPMIKAILPGQKAVTRRMVKFPSSMEARGIRHDLICYTPGGPRWREYEAQLDAKDPEAWGFDAWPPGLCVSCNDETCQHIPCPYGAAGDRLWVREAWQGFFGPTSADWKATPRAERTEANSRNIVYRATQPKNGVGRWVTPLFMPRWASRITLDVVSVRVERLHDITNAEAMLEGVQCIPWRDTGDGRWYTGDPSKGASMHARTPRGAFEKLWVAINGSESWDANPWVWRVEFVKTGVTK